MATLTLLKARAPLPPPGTGPGPGPIEMVIREARRRRRRRWTAGICILVIGAAGAWVVLRGGSSVGEWAARPPRRAGPAGAALAGTSPCTSSLRYGPLPTWLERASTLLTPRCPMFWEPRVTSWPSCGRAFAVTAPPLPGRNNKILWVSRVPLNDTSNLVISARRLAGTRPVGAVQRRVVMGGPGPSGIDMPVRGCWQFSLTWSGHHDAVDLAYSGS